MVLHAQHVDGPSRERAAVVALLLGSLLLGLLTVVGLELYQLLAVLGAVVVIAWLIDGSNRRYMGPGLLALAIGGGMTIGIDLPVEPYERTVVYAGMGAALLMISFVNPEGVRGGGAFLLGVALSASILTWVVTPMGGRAYAGKVGGWEFAIILSVWAAFQLHRLRDADIGSERAEHKESVERLERGPGRRMVSVRPDING